MGVDTTRCGKSFSAASDRKDIGLVDTTAKRLQRAFVVNECDCVAWSKLVKAFLNARQIANDCEIGEVELQLSKDAIQRVVAADDEFHRIAKRLRNRRTRNFARSQ